jgi:hypothetical protein
MLMNELDKKGQKNVPSLSFFFSFSTYMYILAHISPCDSESSTVFGRDDRLHLPFRGFRRLNQ